MYAITPLAADPAITSLNQTTRSHWFIQWFPTGVSRISLQPYKYNREGGRKNKRTNTDLGQLQAQEREFCNTLHSPCICRLSRACILRETSTKATRNVNSSLTVFPHCFLLLTVPPLDCYLTPTCRLHLSVFLCQLTLCLLGDLPFLPHLRSRGRSRC